MIYVTADGDINKSLTNAIESADSCNEIIIEKSVIYNALKRCAFGDLEAHVLTEWANMVELCDYIRYEGGFEKVIADVIFCISSPEINGSLNRHQCEVLMSNLYQGV